ncbi:hypothetical protein ACLOJK_019462, partial [Asimina triloba]
MRKEIEDRKSSSISRRIKDKLCPNLTINTFLIFQQIDFEVEPLEINRSPRSDEAATLGDGAGSRVREDVVPLELVGEKGRTPRMDGRREGGRGAGGRERKREDRAGRRSGSRWEGRWRAAGTRRERREGRRGWMGQRDARRMVGERERDGRSERGRERNEAQGERDERGRETNIRRQRDARCEKGEGRIGREERGMSFACDSRHQSFNVLSIMVTNARVFWQMFCYFEFNVWDRKRDKRTDE